MKLDCIYYPSFKPPIGFIRTAQDTTAQGAFKLTIRYHSKIEPLFNEPPSNDTFI